MTELGKFLRKLRIGKNEILLDMANKLDVSPFFLSAVEIGKKKMPPMWNVRIRELYTLTNAQQEEFERAIAAQKEIQDVR